MRNLRTFTPIQANRKEYNFKAIFFTIKVKVKFSQC